MGDLLDELSRDHQRFEDSDNFLRHTFNNRVIRRKVAHILSSMTTPTRNQVLETLHETSPSERAEYLAKFLPRIDSVSKAELASREDELKYNVKIPSTTRPRVGAMLAIALWTANTMKESLIHPFSISAIDKQTGRVVSRDGRPIIPHT